MNLFQPLINIVMQGIYPDSQILQLIPYLMLLLHIQLKDQMFSFVNSSNFADFYLWNFGDGQTSTESNPDHTYLASGSYIVSLTATNYCGDHLVTETIEVDLALSVMRILSVKTFKIYPNPSDGKIYLELGHLENENISLSR